MSSLIRSAEIHDKPRRSPVLLFGPDVDGTILAIGTTPIVLQLTP